MLRYKPYRLLATIQIPIKLDITNVPWRLRAFSAYERLGSRWRVFNCRNRMSLRVQQQFSLFRRHMHVLTRVYRPCWTTNRTRIGVADNIREEFSNRTPLRIMFFLSPTTTTVRLSKLPPPVFLFTIALRFIYL